MSEKTTAGDAIGATISLLGIAVIAGWLAYGLGATLNAPRVKSDRQLCEERGGVYGELRGAGMRCFAKEAFK